MALIRKRGARYAVVLTGLAMVLSMTVAGTASAHRTVGRAKCTIVGTRGNDHINGTNRADVICGLGGNDVIEGRGGGDVILGGPGRDVLSGTKGNDVLKGGPGRDTLYGDDGNDTLRGGDLKDRLFGNRGSDKLGGDKGFDTLGRRLRQRCPARRRPGRQDARR